MATVCFDLDGTLCTTTGGAYEQAEPYPLAIARVNELARAGHRIIIMTARGTATGIDWSGTTREQLARWGVHFDELQFGKPSADVFVDDRAVHSESWRVSDAFAPPGLSREHVGEGLWGDWPVLPPAQLPGIVELGRTFRGRAVYLERHAELAIAQAHAAGIDRLPPPEVVAERVLASLQGASSDRDVSFAITIAAAGHVARLDAWDGTAGAAVVIDCRPLREIFSALRPMLAAEGQLSIRVGAAGDAPRSWPLLAGGDGTIRPGLGARLVVVRQSRLLSSAPATADVGSLWLQEAAHAEGAELDMGGVREQDLEHAEEAFLLTMPFCLLPVAVLRDRSLVAPGPLAQSLLARWSDSVGLDLAAQAAELLTEPGREVASIAVSKTSCPSVTVVIPARLHSSRLPRKVLAEIDGKPMIEHVHDVAARAGCGPVLVLADDDEVADAVRGFGGEVWMTDREIDSGTARIASVIDRIDADIVVNLQGDAPLTDPDVVALAASEAASSAAPVTMPIYPLGAEDAAHDPSVVKVVRALDGHVLYCSRSPIPFRRDGSGGTGGTGGTHGTGGTDGASFWGHAGLYAYSREFLESFNKLPRSPLEEIERLEQLRWLEAGVRIHSFVIRPQRSSVDTPADLEQIRQLFATRGASV